MSSCRKFGEDDSIRNDNELPLPGKDRATIEGESLTIFKDDYFAVP
jgi:hypothetical protein